MNDAGLCSSCKWQGTGLCGGCGEIAPNDLYVSAEEVREDVPDEDD